MGQTLSIMLGAALLLSAAIATAQTPSAPPAEAPAVAQPAYTYGDVFPQEGLGIGFTMPKQAFLDLLAAKGMTYRANTAANMFAVSATDTQFSSVVYFFNSKAGEILTEVEVRFADEMKAKAYFDAKFPSQNVKGEYLASDGASPYGVKAWRFESKIFVVARMLNTRWANQ